MAQSFVSPSAVTWVPVMVPLMAPQMVPRGSASCASPSPLAWSPIASGVATPTSTEAAGKWRLSASTTAPGSDSSEVVSLSDVEEDVDDAEACNELLEQIQNGGVEQGAAIDALVGSVAELSFDPVSCRVVQAAVECATEDVAAALALELRGRVEDGYQCPHANHVLQKIMEVLPASRTLFVVEELQGRTSFAARHRFGCRVLTRLLERHASSSAPQAQRVVAEIVREAGELSRHTHGHHVVEALLMHGKPESVNAVGAILRQELLRNSKNRSATYVVEKLFQCSSHRQQAELVDLLFGHKATLLELVGNQFGCHVAKAVVRLPYVPEARARVRSLEEDLKKTKFGRRLLTELAAVDAESTTS